MYRVCCLVFLFLLSTASFAQSNQRESVHALYIPLADHYAAIVAYEKYRNTMKFADFKLEQMPNWDYLRAKFLQGNADMAYVMSPLALDMYSKKPIFKWVGLMHRDGNGLAINLTSDQTLDFSSNRSERKPTPALAQYIKSSYQKEKKAIQVAVPHILSTHSVILYKYLNEHNIRLALQPNIEAEVLALAIAPPMSPSFIKGKANRNLTAAIEQSLPWIDIVETDGVGKVSWYSKDVFPSEHGHIECIALASNKAIKQKGKAIKEVMEMIKQAGEDIETARNKGGVALDEIVAMVRKHIPAHEKSAIIKSLDPNLRVINYQNLDIDKPAMQALMDVAIEGGILTKPVDLDTFSHSFVRSGFSQ